MFSVRGIWGKLARLDRVAGVVIAIYVVMAIASLRWGPIPARGFIGGLTFIAGALAFIAGAYLLVRALLWLRREGLWSLSNRLVLAFVFIAVVPVVLLLAMGWLSAYIIYSQLGANLLQNHLENRIDKLASLAEAVAAYAASDARRETLGPDSLNTNPAVRTILSEAQPLLPGLELHVGEGQELLERDGRQRQERFSGLTQTGERVFLRAVVSRKTDRGAVVVSAVVPVSQEFLSRLAPELGLVQVTVWRPAGPEDSQRLVFEAETKSGSETKTRRFVHIKLISAIQQTVPPPVNWMDFEVTGTCKMEAVPVEGKRVDWNTNPVFMPFSARAGQLNRRLFSSLGELGGRPIQLLFLVGIVFLVLVVVALRFGIRVTQSITRAVDELSLATEQVQNGDLTHRVRIQQRDQLGALGESFNEMTGSIASLIEEQRQRQRLENELSIAREVQEQLFPQTLPKVTGIELAALCRAARVVSGDYYDFLSLGPERLGLAIADISGKGISAALLMASLQAALRSQVQLDSQAWQDTAQLVSRLNLHLFLNTSTERYATFFYAAYDAATRTLHYTNAGHLPPLYIVGEQVKQLEEGGMVVGLFDDCTYEQGKIQIEPGALLVAYSDGLIEAENVYGEEYGRKGLLAEVLRHRHETPQRLAEALVQAAEDWTGSPTQADDMTVIVARMG